MKSLVKRALYTGSAVVVLGGGAFALLNGASSSHIEMTAHASKYFTKEVIHNVHATAVRKAFHTNDTGLYKETLHITVPSSGYKNFKATGFMAGPGGKIPIQFQKASLNSIKTSNGTLWYGPMNGTATFPDGTKHPVILATNFVSGTHKYQFAVTVETYTQPIHMFFGKTFVTKNMMAQMKKQNRNHHKVTKTK